MEGTYKYYKSETIPAHQDADGFDIPEKKIKGFTKYVTSSKASDYGYNGFSDDKTTLELSDDAANVNWGGSWRMPTKNEWDELQTKCTWTLTTKNGRRGYIVTSKVAGYTDKWIFLPAAGFRDGNYINGAGSGGDYWSSSLSEDSPRYAWGMYFRSGRVYTSNGGYRCNGRSVRPVAE